MRPMCRPFLLMLCCCAALLPGLVRAQIGGASILLVASTQMQDPRFMQTVVLVTRHGRSPPLGVIINRPLPTTLSEIIPQLPDDEAKRPLFFGGPIAPNTLVFLFRSSKGSDDAIAVAKDIHLGRSSATLNELLSGRHAHSGLRVFAGYAGWADGQLESEIRRGGWHVLPLDRELLFDKDVAQIWPELIRRASQQSVGLPLTAPSILSPSPLPL